MPTEAKSLALIMEDPDVPTSIRADGMWDHWLVWNIDPGTRQVAEGAEPAGIHGRTTSDTLRYTPPCPPDREHRYVFKLYALDAMLELAQGASKAGVLAALEGHVLDQTELIGRYEQES